LPRPIRGISVLGHVDDCADIFGSHRVFVSPIPYGTGIATKNVMAMSFGIPVVTTHFGATSLEIISGVHALISDRADGIADEVVKLYTNPGLWKSIAENGAAHIRDQFSQLRLEEGVREFLSTQISSQLDSYAVGKRSIHLMDRIDPSLREAPSRLECTKIRVGWHLETGDDFVSHHDFESALIQYRHACSWVANSLAHFPEYGRLLVGFRKCYTALNDCEGIHRCELELGRTKQTIPK
jgi:hypothetical protein